MGSKVLGKNNFDWIYLKLGINNLYKQYKHLALISTFLTSLITKPLLKETPFIHMHIAEYYQLVYLYVLK